jgi:hypothetical protein
VSITYAISPNFHFATLACDRRRTGGEKGIEGSRPCARAKTCASPSRSLVLSLPISASNPVEQSRRLPVTAFSLLFAHSFPVTPKSFPVNFDNEFRLKPAWLLRLLVMLSSFGAQIFGFPCIFPCYPGILLLRLVRTRLHRQPSSTVSHVLAGPNTGLIVSTRAPGEPSHAVIEPECEIRPFVSRICPTGICRCRVTCHHPAALLSSTLLLKLKQV